MRLLAAFDLITSTCRLPECKARSNQKINIIMNFCCDDDDASIRKTYSEVADSFIKLTTSISCHIIRLRFHSSISALQQVYLQSQALQTKHIPTVTNYLHQNSSPKWQTFMQRWAIASGYIFSSMQELLHQFFKELQAFCQAVRHHWHNSW